MGGAEPRWRTVYADGSSQDEPQDGLSILAARPYPRALVLLRGLRPMLRIQFSHEFDRPIWYRRFSLELNGLGPRCDGVVLGRASADGQSQLWFWDGSTRPCPPEHIDERMVRHLTGAG